MSAGPKPAADSSALPWRPRTQGSARFAQFCRRFLKVPKGHGNRKPLVIREWQRELVGSVLDAETQPRLAAWCLPRGNGKTSLMAAWALYELFTGEYGASIVCVAVDERQARLLFDVAVSMVALSPELQARCQVFTDRIAIPSRNASLQVLPAEAKRLEGLDASLFVLDELGFVARETFEVLLLAQGKRERSTLVGIGTPGPDPDNVLTGLRTQWLAGDRESFVYREYSADAFQDHPVDCVHCLELCNPALGDFLALDAMRAFLPPRTREAVFRRQRLCQFVTGGGDAFVQPDVWARCTDTSRTIPDRAAVVLGLDCSSTNDTTALVAVSVEIVPRVEVVRIWTPPRNDPGYRVPILDVEDAVRAAAKRWTVRELTADPWGLRRSLELLAEEGMTTSEFPQNASRLTPATSALSEAIHNRELTHTGDPTLTTHVLNAVITDDSRGVRVAKVTRNSARKIDGLVAMLMAFERAKFYMGQKPRSRRVVAF